MNDYTAEELDRRALLTEQIATNLQTIRELEGELDLDELMRKTSAIAEDLKIIEDDNTDLDELAEQTGAIAGNLKAIAELA